jgi:glycosyltransferase involved in cell wall biosynthesis
MAHSYTEHSDWTLLVSDPLVSVVMPAYNHERYLREAIEGVIGQKTNFPFELIISDDCSTDGTLGIALRYQLEYPRLIRVLSSDRRVGMHENDARIYAVVRGMYLAFCEGDDSWHRADKLSKQVAVLQKDPRVALVCSSWRTVSDDGVLLVPDVLALDKTCLHPFGLDEILSGHVKTLTVCTNTAVIQRALRESPLCKTGRYPFGDAPMWVEASQRGDCLCLPEEYATYRLSRDSVTRPHYIMDVYRFIAGAAEFDRDVLGIYRLPRGEKAAVEVRIQATRKRLRALAFLGESSKVREELWWLCRLGAKVNIQDYLLYLGAVFSQPGTIGAAWRKWALLRWHAFTKRRTGAIPITRPFESAVGRAATRPDAEVLPIP